MVMQKVFTDQSIALVGAMRSYLAEHGIDSQLRNEYSSSVMGEIAFFDVWPELWVRTSDYAKSVELLDNVKQNVPNGPDWQCRHCGEANPGTFEICWDCSEPNARHTQ